MADPAKFDHDRLAHLLEDRLLIVPKFQRAYAWDEANVKEFLSDLALARQQEREYFIGTVVLADSDEIAPRQLIVDGQQRLATTAVLLLAIRDRLHELGSTADAASVESRFIKRYETGEGELTRLVLSPSDLAVYDDLVAGSDPEQDGPLRDAYEICMGEVLQIAPTEDDSDELLAVIKQLANEVQVLLAIASGIPEAYVIFETLNDRGADLTTADLLKNFLFSRCTVESIGFVESIWTEVSSAFDKPDELVKFIRFEYSSRNGKVTNRQLYRALQGDIGDTSTAVKSYMRGLKKALGVYQALRDPDHKRWTSLNYDVRDSLLAHRRFGFESSWPLLLSVFREWDDKRGGKVINLVTGWTVRAMMAGKLGGSQAEDMFCTAAKAVADGSATNQAALRKLVANFVPADGEFRQAFLSYPSFTTTRAKYLLGMIEKHARSGNVALPDWSSKGITIEHILKNSSKREDFASDDEFETFEGIRNQLCNFALLEKGLNKKADDLPFAEKRELYKESGYPLTRKIGEQVEWTVADGEAYAVKLAKYAAATWRK